MTPILLKTNQHRSAPITSKLTYLGYCFQNIPSKLLSLFLTLCLFSFTMFYIQNVQAQTYTGSYSFVAQSITRTFNYSVAYNPAPSTSALVTVTFTTALPTGFATPQLRLGPAIGPFTFVNMTGTGPYTYNMTGVNCCPHRPFIFRFAWASGGLYESPLQNFPLPITLTDFSTTKNDYKSALLTWKTSSEINSDYFGIERSTDGTEWDYIGKLNAAGNSNTELTYNYIDADLPLNTNRTTGKIYYYRLRLTDLDGSYKYSDIRGINISTEFTQINIYPNPTKDRINVDLSGINTQAGEVKFGIYDHKGAEIMTKIITGSGIELIDLNHLPSAIYNITIKQGLETIHQSSMIKMD